MINILLIVTIVLGLTLIVIFGPIVFCHVERQEQRLIDELDRLLNEPRGRKNK